MDIIWTLYITLTVTLPDTVLNTHVQLPSDPRSRWQRECDNKTLSRSVFWTWATRCHITCYYGCMYRVYLGTAMASVSMPSSKDPREPGGMDLDTCTGSGSLSLAFFRIRDWAYAPARTPLVQPLSSRDCSLGSAALTLSWDGSPAYIPDMKGSTSRVNTSFPVIIIE
jgi:hypothetical protein